MEKERFIDWPATMRNLQSAIIQSNIPKGVVAGRAGVSAASLSNYFAGRGIPSAETLLKLQQVVSFQIVWR